MAMMDMDVDVDDVKCYRYRFDESGPLAIATFAIMLAIVVLTMLHAISNAGPFWTFIAAWVLLIVLLPEFVNNMLNGTSARIAAALSLAIFSGYLFLGPTGPSINDLIGVLSLIPAGMIIFSLCMATLLLINERGHGHMIRQFLMVTTFLSYETVILIHGPIAYYHDMFFGSEWIQGNTEFMIYFIVGTAVGLALSLIVNSALRRRTDDMGIDAMER